MTPVAENDLARIYDFNLQRAFAWAEKVENRLAERVTALLGAPNVGRPLMADGVKRVSVTDIQYLIDYEIVDDCVRILRIRHTREIR